MRWLQGLVIAGLLSSLNGCAFYRSKLVDQPVENIGIFADHTMSMLSSVEIGVTRDETILIRRFLDGTSMEERRLIELDDQMQHAVHSIVLYSIELVNISESDQEEARQISQYADYITTFKDDMLLDEKIKADYFDSTIADVRSQETLLAALRAAQPLLNAAVVNAAIDLDLVADAINDVVLLVDTRIDEEYKELIRYRRKLEDEKASILTAFEEIYDAYREPVPDLSRLKASGTIWDPEMIPDKSPTLDDLSRIVEHLEARLTALHTVQNEIAEDWNEYIATHQELDRVGQQAGDRAKQMRIIMLAWVRAHQQMASGTRDPADWFDVGEFTRQVIINAPRKL